MRRGPAVTTLGTALLLVLLSTRPLPAAPAPEREGTFIRMEEVEIIGVIEHPEVTYIIPKTRIRFQRIPLERSFAGRAGRLLDPLQVEEEITLRTLAGAEE